ncbi:MAG: MBL fold metallo-hydrolase [Beijerinckiaceae bacterium]
MKRTITILGCGSSGGVPRVGSGWGACDPLEPRNRRRRCSVLIRQMDGDKMTSVLVDTGPDMREQLLDANVQRLDAVVYTHDHADHTHGIDDIRPLVLHSRRRIDAFCDERTSQALWQRFDYIFRTPKGSDYPPILTERRIESGTSFEVTGDGGAMPIMPFRLIHGSIDAQGLRVGDMAYTPDVSAVPEESVPYLANLDLWIIDALRVTPHPTHFNLEQALEWIARMKPKRAVLTNLHTDLDYRTLCNDLPATVVPAFDGLALSFA